MSRGTNDQASTKNGSTSAPGSGQTAQQKAKERQLFAGLAEVKQWPIAPDDELPPGRR
jgi:hypothetical protein